MNKKSVWLIIFASLVALFFLLRHYKTSEQTENQPVSLETNEAISALARTDNTHVNESAVLTGNTGLNPETNFDASNSNRINQMAAIAQSVKNEWRTPIQFYGRVVDENTNPVTGAQIDFRCNDFSETGTSIFKSTSDEQGMFSIQGISGKLLTVNVTKAGYYTSKQDNDSFYYAGQNVNFTPDIYNPVLFHLRKKGKAESLTVVSYPGFAHIVQLHHDGTPIELDLLNGTQTPAGTGQLKLEFWKSTAGSNDRNFDWKLQLSVPGGGLVSTDEEFAFQAPQNGYQPSILIDMSATNQSWQGEIRNKYYIKLSDGKFGMIDFYLLPRNGAFTVHSAINPTGSQNLEPAN
ncbi:MAG TPA: carboxypeptidase-like regulatory domain-containing protein [Verrucomicrobiae bacterium]